jgi:hypothetical protein
MNTYNIVSASTGKTLFTGSKSQCDWFVEVKGIESAVANGFIIWVN